MHELRGDRTSDHPLLSAAQGIVLGGLLSDRGSVDEFEIEKEVARLEMWWREFVLLEGVTRDSALTLVTSPDGRQWAVPTQLIDA